MLRIQRAKSSSYSNNCSAGAECEAHRVPISKSQTKQLINLPLGSQFTHDVHKVCLLYNYTSANLPEHL